MLSIERGIGYIGATVLHAGHLMSHRLNKSDALPPSDKHAQQYAAVRNAHETELLEDYVELIGDLLRHQGEARSADVAARMGVSQATVSKTVARLKALDLVSSQPYRSLFLTEKGEAMADMARQRHATVLQFLRALGVSDATARIDAEGMEHHVSDETLEIMRHFTMDQQRCGS